MQSISFHHWENSTLQTLMANNWPILISVKPFIQTHLWFFLWWWMSPRVSLRQEYALSEMICPQTHDVRGISKRRWRQFLQHTEMHNLSKNTEIGSQRIERKDYLEHHGKINNLSISICISELRIIEKI